MVITRRQRPPSKAGNGKILKTAREIEINAIITRIPRVVKPDSAKAINVSAIATGQPTLFCAASRSSGVEVLEKNVHTIAPRA